jgi:CAI-1 autoinducer synthase
VHAFFHNNIEHLEKQIMKYGPGVVAVDSVYSTTGTVCPLVELVEICERYDCIIVVDESHSLGTHGPMGAGLVVEHGLEDKVHFRTASLAKAFAGRAGVITCTNRFYDYFKFHALPAIFSSTLLQHELAALEKTLDVVMAADDRRERLMTKSAYLRDGLEAVGYYLLGTETQIIPLEAGEEWRTMQLRDALEERDVFGAVFCAPATSLNRSMVRLSLNADLEQDQLDNIIEACDAIKDQVNYQLWPSKRKEMSRRRSRARLTSVE